MLMFENVAAPSSSRCAPFEPAYATINAPLFPICRSTARFHCCAYACGSPGTLDAMTVPRKLLKFIFREGGNWIPDGNGLLVVEVIAGVAPKVLLINVEVELICEAAGPSCARVGGRNDRP